MHNINSADTMLYQMMAWAYKSRWKDISVLSQPPPGQEIDREEERNCFHNLTCMEGMTYTCNTNSMVFWTSSGSFKNTKYWLELQLWFFLQLTNRTKDVRHTTSWFHFKIENTGKQQSSKIEPSGNEKHPNILYGAIEISYSRIQPILIQTRACTPEAKLYLGHGASHPHSLMQTDQGQGRFAVRRTPGYGVGKSIRKAHAFFRLFLTTIGLRLILL